MAERVDIGNGTGLSEMGHKQHHSRPLRRTEVWGRQIRGKATELNQALHEMLGLVYVPPENSETASVPPKPDFATHTVKVINRNEDKPAELNPDELGVQATSAMVDEIRGQSDKSPSVMPQVYDRDKER